MSKIRSLTTWQDRVLLVSVTSGTLWSYDYSPLRPVCCQEQQKARVWSSHELRRVKRSINFARQSRRRRTSVLPASTIRTGNNAGRRGGSMNTRLDKDRTNKHHRIPKSWFACVWAEFVDAGERLLFFWLQSRKKLGSNTNWNFPRCSSRLFR